MNYNQLSEKYNADAIAIRHHIHANPELSFEEYNTCNFVAEKLTAYGIAFTKGVAGTGLVGIIKGKNSEKHCIAFRADLDALPIQEKNEVTYKSTIDGVMHACGHDVHTACLLAAARILNETKDNWEGTVKLIFQPGEEKDPGGASIMIKENVLENPKVNAIYALHVYPNLPSGTIGLREGIYMASADEVYITIKGKGGHAALPHLCIDPVIISAQLLLDLQTLVSRKRNPLHQTVLTFGKISGGTKCNIIPDEVVLEGTLRCMNETWRKEIQDLIKQHAEDFCKMQGATADVKILHGYPCVHNDAELTKKTRTVLQDYFGNENIKELDLRMTADDFSFYTHHIPGCYIRLGTSKNNKEFLSSVHTPTFNIDEAAIKTGIETICAIVEGY